MGWADPENEDVFVMGIPESLLKDPKNEADSFMWYCLLGVFKLSVFYSRLPC